MGPFLREGISAVSKTQFFSLCAVGSRETVNAVAIASMALVWAAPAMNEQFTLQQYCLRLLANPRSQLGFWCACYAGMFFLVTVTIFSLSSSSSSLFFFFLIKWKAKDSRLSLSPFPLANVQCFPCEVKLSQGKVKKLGELRFSETTRSFCCLP